MPRSSDPGLVFPSVMTSRTFGFPAGLHPPQKKLDSASLRALSVRVPPIQVKLNEKYSLGFFLRFFFMFHKMYKTNYTIRVIAGRTVTMPTLGP